MFGSLKIKAKLILFFLLVGLIPLSVSGVLAYYNYTVNSQRQAMLVLTTYTRMINQYAENFFAEKVQTANFLANSQPVQKGLSAMLEAPSADSPPAAAERVREAAGLIEGMLRPVLEKDAYSGGFVTNARGVVAASTDFQDIGKDYARQSYVQGALNQQVTWSSLGGAADRTQTVAVPVISQATGELYGALNLVIDSATVFETISGGMSELGETARAYLVTAEGSVLWQFQNTARQTAITSVENTATQQLMEAMENNDYDFRNVLSYRCASGEPVFGAAEILLLGRHPVGLVVEVSEREAMSGMIALRNLLLIIGAASAAAILMTGYYLARSIAGPLQVVTFVAGKIAKGNVSDQTVIKRKDYFKRKRMDEIGLLAGAFNTMNKGLRELMRKVVATADGVNEIAGSLSSSVEATASSISQVAATAGEFADNTNQLSTSAQEIAGISREVTLKARRGGESVANIISQMKEINEIVEGLNSALAALGKRSEEIGNIVRIITSVAGQTNLLALNAAIEAARAGEQGRGFAVVADEVRKLAEETAKAAGEIAGLIEAIQQETKDTMGSMAKAVREVHAGTEVVTASGEMFQDIVRSVEQMVVRIQEISAATEEMGAGSEEVAAATQEQAAAMQEINATVENLQSAAEELYAVLKRFRY